MDYDYESKFECSTSSMGSANLCAQLNSRRAQQEQQAERRPLVRVTPEEKSLTQMQAQIDRLLVERSIPDPVQEVLLET